jgi:CHAT domain-containing protein/tetratricopeptide (TPR) repeat protein
MTAHELVEQLLALPEAEAQKRFLEEHASLLGDEVATALKDQATCVLRSDIRCALEIAGLILCLAEFTQNPLDRAIGLWAEAHARSIGLGEYQQALQLYDEASCIYQVHGRTVEWARVQAGKVWPLACLGDYAQATETGLRAGDILRAHAEWRSLATLEMNLAIVHGRQGEDRSALTLFESAGELYRRLGAEGEPFLPLIEQNRAIVLRNLGQFEASVEASHTAWEALAQSGQKVEAARARQNLAITYFVLGRYNEALKLLDEVRDVFLADGRNRDAILVELFISDCLLQLRRFIDVLDKCRQVRKLFTDLGIRFEVGQAMLNEAVAYAGLHQYDKAMASLAETRCLFVEEGNDVYVAITDLERAGILLRQGALDESRQVIEACIDVFQQRDLSVKATQARLVAARIAAALGQTDRAVDLVNEALHLGARKNIPSITYQSHHLLGSISQKRDDPQKALAEYELAILELERLRGQLMIEFRSDFLEDKHAVYEDVVCLCLDMDQPIKGLEYVERAKSRALVDLLAHRLDLSIRAKSAQDVPLVQELSRLRSERDRLYRRWEGEGGIYTRGQQQQVQQDVLALEKRITDLWHRLLVSSADYARDAALWHVRTEPVQPYLDDDTLILEYFVARGQLIAFVITAEEVQAHVLPGDLAHIQPLVRLLWLNFRAVPKSAERGAPNLAENARGLLRRLYALLMGPLRNRMMPYRRIIIVPHGSLHYLPFHALYDGDMFVIEQYEISYLPGASLLRYCHEIKPAGTGLAAFGYSCEGRLPYAAQEARSVAQIMAGQAVLEDELTSARLREEIKGRQTLHLATHGDFRPDNPLFSGLALSDGWLTTLDIFNLCLDASLVTLSACQTGRNVIGGGDELLGLMRAFLYAGTSSLVLSFWSVEDRSTAQLMGTFYRQLADGWTKGAALRHAQLQFIKDRRTGDAAADAYAHPYFWAPFFLVGDSGPL